MRITLIYAPPIQSTSTHNPTAEARRIWHYAGLLRQQGYDVIWISSPTTADALSSEIEITADDIAALPPTCRYVLPCQPYRLDDLQLICVDQSIWLDPALHTRLFTFLCLLHQAQPSQAWHTWEDGLAVFVAVYTARFLSLPIALSKSLLPPSSLDQTPFTQQWIARQSTLLVVHSLAAQHQLQAHGLYPAERIHVVQPTAPDVGAMIRELYCQLRHG